MEYEAESTFSKLPDDVVLKIFTLLEDHPRSWACLSCVCTKFNSLMSSVCFKSKCASSLSSDVLSLPSSSSDGCSWSSLFKLSVCCPGLYHCGVLLDNSDFGLYREIGSDTDSGLSVSSLSSLSSQVHHKRHHSYCTKDKSRDDDIHHLRHQDYRISNGSRDDDIHHQRHHDYRSLNGSRDDDNNNDGSGGGCISSSINNNNICEGWSLYDDLYLDTVYDNSETSTPVEVTTGVATLDTEFKTNNKRRKNNHQTAAENRKHRSHLATGAWNLSREQGLKLLASRFRDDCLYISDWPGCVHSGSEKDDDNNRSYMLFRGVFNNFKKTRVWRTINDGGSFRSKVDINCAFCKCKGTWDLHSAFCLKRGFGFHDDGEPVVRAYVCENGHVSGAWTDFPMYT